MISATFLWIAAPVLAVIGLWLFREVQLGLDRIEREEAARPRRGDVMQGAGWLDRIGDN